MPSEHHLHSRIAFVVFVAFAFSSLDGTGAAHPHFLRHRHLLRFLLLPTALGSGIPLFPTLASLGRVEVAGNPRLHRWVISNGMPPRAISTCQTGIVYLSGPGLHHRRVGIRVATLVETVAWTVVETGTLRAARHRRLEIEHFGPGIGEIIQGQMVGVDGERMVVAPQSTG